MLRQPVPGDQQDDPDRAGVEYRTGIGEDLGEEFTDQRERAQSLEQQGAALRERVQSLEQGAGLSPNYPATIQEIPELGWRWLPQLKSTN